MWLEGQRRWSLAVLHTADAGWTALPMTPTQAAADVSRSDATAARFAFTADLEDIDRLLLLDDTEQARQAIAIMLEKMAAAHPARYSQVEVAALRERVIALPPDTQSPHFNQKLDGLARRSHVRNALPAIADALAAAVGPASSRSIGFQPVNPSFSSADDDIVFATAQPDAEGCWVAAARRLSATAWLGLAVPASELIDHYWQPATEKSWRVVPAGAEPAEIRLCNLGPPFGNADLLPGARQSAGSQPNRTGGSFWWR